MTPTPDPEFLHLVEACESLERVAQEHEAHEGDCPIPCFGNRIFMAAMALRHLGLGPEELGEICRHLIDMEHDDEEDDEPEKEVGDDILNAKEIA